MLFCKYCKSFLLKKIFLPILIVIFSLNIVISPSYAQFINYMNLPAPGTMITPTNNFNPAIIKGVNIYPDDPLKFDFIIDKGQTGLDKKAFKKESNKLIKYFLASLTTPEDEMWVNLSPYEKDRIIPDSFGKTEMGRDLLSQDYILKQLMSSLMYPENKLGKTFWERVYSKAQEQFGTTDIPLNTFNKVWIVASNAKIYEHKNGAFVIDSHLKVMLEEDYIAMSHQKNMTESRAPKRDLAIKEGRQTSDVRRAKDDPSNVSHLTSNVIKQILIPELEHEVNTGETFANLRQIYNSMILATWYKNALKRSLLGKIYANKKKLAGVENNDPLVKEKIYNQYLESFNKGVFNFIKEEYDPGKQEIIPRKYFSGGIIYNPRQTKETKINYAMLNKEDFAQVTTSLEEIQQNKNDSAMAVKDNITTLLGENYGKELVGARLKAMEKNAQNNNSFALTQLGAHYLAISYKQSEQRYTTKETQKISLNKALRYFKEAVNAHSKNFLPYAFLALYNFEKENPTTRLGALSKKEIEFLTRNRTKDVYFEIKMGAHFLAIANAKKELLATQLNEKIISALKATITVHETLALQNFQKAIEKTKASDGAMLSQNQQLIKDQIKILLVEDDYVTAKLMKGLFEDYGFSIITIAHNSAEALAEYNNNEFDIIITDFELPDKNAIALANEIKKTNKNDIPMILLTTNLKATIAFLSDKPEKKSLFKGIYSKDDNFEIIVNSLEKIFKIDSAMITKRRGEKKLLLVDDSPIILENFINALADTGYTSITTAERGKEAIKIIEKNKFDLIITDKDMPEMNGIQFAKTAKKNNITSPIILLSNDINETNKHIYEALKLFVEILPKHIDPEELINILDKRLGLNDPAMTGITEEKLDQINKRIEELMVQLVGDKKSLPRLEFLNKSNLSLENFASFLFDQVKGLQDEVNNSINSLNKSLQKETFTQNFSRIQDRLTNNIRLAMLKTAKGIIKMNVFHENELAKSSLKNVLLNGIKYIAQAEKECSILLDRTNKYKVDSAMTINEKYSKVERKIYDDVDDLIMEAFETNEDQAKLKKIFWDSIMKIAFINYIANQVVNKNTAPWIKNELKKAIENYATVSELAALTGINASIINESLLFNLRMPLFLQNLSLLPDKDAVKKINRMFTNAKNKSSWSMQKKQRFQKNDNINDYPVSWDILPIYKMIYTFDKKRNYNWVYVKIFTYKNNAKIQNKVEGFMPARFFHNIIANLNKTEDEADSLSFIETITDLKKILLRNNYQPDQRKAQKDYAMATDNNPALKLDNFPYTITQDLDSLVKKMAKKRHNLHPERIRSMIWDSIKDKLLISLLEKSPDITDGVQKFYKSVAGNSSFEDFAKSINLDKNVTSEILLYYLHSTLLEKNLYQTKKISLKDSGHIAKFFLNERNKAPWRLEIKTRELYVKKYQKNKTYFINWEKFPKYNLSYSFNNKTRCDTVFVQITSGPASLYKTYPNKRREINKNDFYAIVDRLNKAEIDDKLENFESALHNLQKIMFNDSNSAMTAEERNNYNVLFVDNNEASRTIFEMAFPETGYNITTSSIGKEALELLKTGKFHAVLTNKDNPKMDGPIFSKKIREELKLKIPIIMVTANQFYDTKDDSVDMLIHKPVDNEILASSLDKLLKPIKEPVISKREDIRILYVEDEETTREATLSLLKKLGFTTITTVENAEEALHSFYPDKFDLVITDLLLPGISGEELAEEIKKHSPGTPVLLTSGTLNLVKNKNVFDGRFEKPIEIKKITQKIDNIFNIKDSAMLSLANNEQDYIKLTPNLIEDFDNEDYEIIANGYLPYTVSQILYNPNKDVQEAARDDIQFIAKHFLTIDINGLSTLEILKHLMKRRILHKSVLYKLHELLENKNTGLKILLVDDEDELLRKTIEDIYQQGYTNISFAKNGIEAFDLIKENLNTNNTFNIVIADQNMPGLKGYQLARKIKKELNGTLTFILHTDGIKTTHSPNNIYGIAAKKDQSIELIKLLKTISQKHALKMKKKMQEIDSIKNMFRKKTEFPLVPEVSINNGLIEIKTEFALKENELLNNDLFLLKKTIVDKNISDVFALLEKMYPDHYISSYYKQGNSIYSMTGKSFLVNIKMFPKNYPAMKTKKITLKAKETNVLQDLKVKDIKKDSLHYKIDKKRTILFKNGLKILMLLNKDNNTDVTLYDGNKADKILFQDTFPLTFMLKEKWAIVKESIIKKENGTFGFMTKYQHLSIISSREEDLEDTISNNGNTRTIKHPDWTFFIEKENNSNVSTIRIIDSNDNQLFNKKHTPRENVSLFQLNWAKIKALFKSKSVLFIEDKLPVFERNKHNILLISNETVLSEKIQSLLKLDGYTSVTHAKTGNIALTTLEEQKFDAVIADKGMQDMNHLKILSFIKKIDIKMPVILITDNDNIAPSLEPNYSKVVNKDKFVQRLVPALDSVFYKDYLATNSQKRKAYNILFIHRNENYRKEVKKNLEALGFNVMTAYNTKDAQKPLESGLFHAVIVNNDFLNPNKDTFDSYFARKLPISFPVITLASSLSHFIPDSFSPITETIIVDNIDAFDYKNLSSSLDKIFNIKDAAMNAKEVTPKVAMKNAKTLALEANLLGFKDVDLFKEPQKAKRALILSGIKQNPNTKQYFLQYSEIPLAPFEGEIHFLGKNKRFIGRYIKTEKSIYNIKTKKRIAGALYYNMPFVDSINTKDEAMTNIDRDQIKVLFVTDNEEDGSFFQTNLQKTGLNVSIALSSEDTLLKVKKEKFDVVVITQNILEEHDPKLGQKIKRKKSPPLVIAIDDKKGINFSYNPTTVDTITLSSISDLDFPAFADDIDLGLQFIKSDKAMAVKNHSSIIDNRFSNDFDQRSTINDKRIKGGIDLNPKNLHMQIQRDGNGVALPIEMQDIENIQIDGFMPIIINIQPITNLPLLLGLVENTDSKKVRSQELSPFDKIKS